jgi:hypothetical protein
MFGAGDFMQPDFEMDLRDQRERLFTLLGEMETMQAGTPAVDELAKEIGLVQNLIFSYEAVAWYERLKA